MLDYKYMKKNGEEWIETSLTGKPLLTTPQINKGTAFTTEERQLFGLVGKLPAAVESLETQVLRAYSQYQDYTSPLQKNIFLHHLHDTNQVLFYQLVRRHIAEMLPIIYTPTVGTAVTQFSREFRQARGIYLAYPDREHIQEILRNRSNPDIELIVVTDGEGVLGIGDQGMGGMAISVAKLMVYTLCGGINPAKTLSIHLDVGTNNETLLADPFYLGWRHTRISGNEYRNFINTFISAVKAEFPSVFLHWEDFGRDNARYNLEQFRHQLCSFNDDIQGTGVVTLAALLAATNASGLPLSEHRIAIFGAGTAGTGIADQIANAMVRQGLSLADAQQRIWLIDKQGLLLNNMQNLTSGQQPFARIASDYPNAPYSLLDTVKIVAPTILIGCSARAGAFTQEVIQTMAANIERPIILPLSNPNPFCEATPIDILTWTNNKAFIATGSPFANLMINGKDTRIAQCNNALAFPGIGLGVLAVKAQEVTENMLWAACKTLSNHAPVQTDPTAPLLPSIEEAIRLSRNIAIVVGQQAQADGVASILESNMEQLVDNVVWEPRYLPYRKLPTQCS